MTALHLAGIFIAVGGALFVALDWSARRSAAGWIKRIERARRDK